MEEIIIKERETKEKIVELVNNSKLPAFILKPIFKDMYDQLNILEEQQYKIAQKTIKEKEGKQNGQN